MQTGLSAAVLGVTSTVRGYRWVRDRQRPRRVAGRSPVSSCRTLLGQHVGAWRALLAVLGGDDVTSVHARRVGEGGERVVAV